MELTYRVRHIDGRYLWWEGDDQSFTCELSKDPYKYKHTKKISVCASFGTALHALCSTPYGTMNLRLVAYADGVEVSARAYSRFFERFMD
jgi:hypothetical protein